MSDIESGNTLPTPEVQQSPVETLGRRQESPDQRVAQTLQRLEKSNVGPALKELLNGYLENSLSGIELEVYAEKVKERGNDISVGELVEGVADTYLSEHPDINEKFQKGEIGIAQLADGVFDLVFQEAIAANSSPDRSEQLAQVNQILREFKSVMRSNG